MDGQQPDSLERLLQEIRLKLQQGVKHGFFDLLISGEKAKGDKRAVTVSLALRERFYVQPNEEQ